MSLASMGMVFWPTPVSVGGQMAGGSTTWGFNVLTFDSGTDRIAYVGKSPVTDSLAKLYFRTATVATGSTVEIRIESVTNGRPSGTLIAANTNVTVVIANSDDNVLKTATLTAAASLTVGQDFAIVIVNSSGTPNLQILTTNLALVNHGGEFPLILQDTGAGTYASTGNNQSLCWVVEFTTAGVVWMPALSPMDGTGLTAFNSGTTPNERALKFVPPMACRVIGVRVALFNLAAAADFTYSLWPASSTTDADVLAQGTCDGDNTYSTTADGFFDLFFAPVSLTAGSTYYLGIRADTANSLALGDFSNSGVTNGLRAFGIPASVNLATRTWTAGSAGVWSPTTTQLPAISLIIDQLGTDAGGVPMSRVFTGM